MAEIKLTGCDLASTSDTTVYAAARLSDGLLRFQPVTLRQIVRGAVCRKPRGLRRHIRKAKARA